MNPDRVRIEWKGPDCEEIWLRCEHCRSWKPAQEIAIASYDSCNQESYVCEICDGLAQAERDLAEHAQEAYGIPLASFDWYEDKAERMAQGF
jgi:hypothetical protein